MPRAIVIDDNTSVHNGHYNELSSLLLSAAVDAGYRPVLAAHQDFQENSSLPENCQVLRSFTTRRMTRWSCGFDGQSLVARDSDATPLIRTMKARFLASRDEWFARAQWRPSEMLRRWSDGLTTILETLNPTSDDELIFQTADDFMMVAMARAMARFRSRRFRIKAIFHYAVYGVHETPAVARREFDQQLNGALQKLTHHDVSLFATTEELAEQMNRGSLSKPVHVLPYPIRKTPQVSKSVARVPRILLGGVHRVEQGRDAVAPFLEAIYEPFVQTGRCTLTLRIDPKHWQKIVPASLHDRFSLAIKRQARLNSAGNDSLVEQLPELDVQPATLSESGYYRMLASGDLGVLLYDADRYKVRCSGVLLELLTRGVPVFVPDDCWLGTVVKTYSRPHPIGYTYRDSREITGLIERFLENRESLQSAAKQMAPLLSQGHSPLATFNALMGVKLAGWPVASDLYAA